MTQARALQILQTGANVFLTGEPGSGKTFVTNAYVLALRKAHVEVAVTASTGIAATHLCGMTIHAWSGIGIARRLSNWDVDRISSNEWVVKRVARVRVLIIDEISMLDAATLDSVDRVCRAIKQRDEPFGGIQVVFVGDFFQLPPVTRLGEEPALFAFAGGAWQTARPLVCYLSEQHRQEDAVFTEVLVALRRNAVSSDHCDHLLKQRRDGEGALRDVLKLYSHNEDVDHINAQELERVLGKARAFVMYSSGKRSLVEQLKRGCLSPETLLLKKGAAVMCTKNNPKGSFVNGSLGHVEGFDEDSGYPVVKMRDGRSVVVEPMDWSLEEHGKPVARITQVPLRLAWAITVHKSQGMSLDAAVVDLRKAFVEGQGYVALSRVRTLAGLSLLGWNDMALRVHPEVLEQDEVFRAQSQDAEAAFASIPAPELATMHSNFVRACGGSISDATKPPHAYALWSEEDDNKLVQEYRLGKKVKELASLFGRQPGAIRSRLKKLLP